MKKSTRLILAASAVGFGLAANAQVTFTKSEGTFPEGGVFSDTHRYNAFAADLTNSGRMDIIYGGQLDTELNGENGLPGIWGWSQQQGVYFNLGNDSWKQDKYTSQRNDINKEDGTVEEHYDVIAATHGLRGNCHANYAAIDYNNDGLVDLIFNGRSNSDDWLPYDGELKKNHLCLYKNNGDGTFTLVPEAVFPVGSPDNEAKGFNISTGDFDRDGYVDFLVSYCLDIDDEKAEFNNGMGRFVGLYKNMNGTGEFKRINNIAETKGGVWTKEIKDDQDNVVTPREEIKGAFLQISGNAILADVNNDGWLDIVLVGYVTDCWDENHPGGGYKSRIYLSEEGKKFVDVTPESSAYTTKGDAATVMADMDGDGYLDMVNYGWDGQRGAYIFKNTQDANAPFDDMPLTSADTNLPYCQARFFVRDMDGDGTPDVIIAGKEYTNFPGEDPDARDLKYLTVCYNTGMDTFDRTEYEDLGEIGDSGRGVVADFDGDGLSDYFCGGYKQKAGVFYNKGEKPVAAEAPANVQAEYVDGKLNITWDEVADAEAYNVYIKNAAGQVYCLVPADPETGFVKVSEGRVSALRPNQTSYSVTVPEGNYKVGVQTLSLLNETSSAFATTQTSGINGVGADAQDVKLAVNVTENGIYVAGAGEAVEVYNAMGQKVAAGVAGKFIPTAAKGVLIVARGTETAKIVK